MLSELTKNPGGSDSKINLIYLSVQRLAHHAAYNKSITGLIVLPNKMITESHNFDALMVHNFIFKMSC